MFTFHHVNAFQVPAPSVSNGNGNGSSGRQLLVLDTVGWDKISFENSQHNLTTDYYKGKQGRLRACMQPLSCVFITCVHRLRNMQHLVCLCM